MFNYILNQTSKTINISACEFYLLDSVNNIINNSNNNNNNNTEAAEISDKNSLYFFKQVSKYDFSD